MYRKIYKKLLDWKNALERKPLMLLGARQVGKTLILDKFCKNEYKNYININSLQDIDIELKKAKVYRELSEDTKLKYTIERLCLNCNNFDENNLNILENNYFNEIEKLLPND